MSRTRFLALLLGSLVVVGVEVGWLLTRGDRSAPGVVKASEVKVIDGFGYSAAFDSALAKIGQITPDEFAKRYPGRARYVEKLSWDPTTAKFWDQFEMDPNADGAQVRARGRHAALWAEMQRQRAEQEGKQAAKKGPPMQPAKGLYDFRLKGDERTHFRRNGFVVSERMGAASPTEMFYRIYERDLPVFITSDAVLHAWHRSYDSILEEIETAVLSSLLEEMLAGMTARLPEAKRAYGAGVLGDSLTDADYFIAVARSLLAGQPTKCALGQEERVARTLKAVHSEQLEDFALFGRERKVDFSQFKPRGHYENSEALKRYFRAMMWCGRIDLRVAGKPELASPREMGAAIVLNDLLVGSGKFERWRQFDRMLQTFVGRADSMTFAQLGGVLNEAAIKSPGDVKDLDTLADLQKRILTGKVGLQHIRGDHFRKSQDQSERFELPRSFTLIGQRFAVDSWATAKVVHDDISWDGESVMRRIPSSLDVAFAALGNDQVVPELVGRMKDERGRKLRDGLNYQHNLAAVRDVVDSLDTKVWKENLYTSWLGCLRELSAPTTDSKYPEAMRTRAWAMKTVNTQLASWTQLRHDTILYVKQSYTMEVSCFYPAGYVEPVPHFWSRLGEMATRAGALVEQTSYPDGKDIKRGHVAFFKNFANTAGKLKVIAEKELAQKEMSKEELKFLEEVVQLQIGCGGPRRYTGWYPGLFYSGRSSSEKWDALVADIHTNVPSPLIGDPGCVLHQGVGNVDLLVIAIDNGKDRMVYAGPLLSHYEFEMTGTARKSDSEWRADLNAGRVPPRPGWTKGYLVPGTNPEARKYKREER